MVERPYHQYWLQFTLPMLWHCLASLYWTRIWYAMEISQIQTQRMLRKQSTNLCLCKWQKLNTTISFDLKVGWMCLWFFFFCFFDFTQNPSPLVNSNQSNEHKYNADNNGQRTMNIKEPPNHLSFLLVTLCKCNDNQTIWWHNIVH